MTVNSPVKQKPCAQGECTQKEGQTKQSLLGTHLQKTFPDQISRGSLNFCLLVWGPFELCITPALHASNDRSATKWQSTNHTLWYVEPLVQRGVLICMWFDFNARCNLYSTLTTCCLRNTCH